MACQFPTTTDDKDVATLLKKQADEKAAIATKHKSANNAEGKECTTTDGNKRVLNLNGSKVKPGPDAKRPKSK